MCCLMDDSFAVGSWVPVWGVTSHAKNIVFGLLFVDCHRGKVFCGSEQKVINYIG